MKKIPISEMVRTAEQIAAAAGITRERAIRALKVAYGNIGFEVELDPPSANGRITLDFTGKADPKKTWPVSPMRALS